MLEAIVSKSEKSSLKMAYYGAYYTIFQDEIKKNALAVSSDPKNATFVEAWNYPNVY